MKKILFIALLATATFAVSCTNDSDAITPSQGIQDKESFALKVGDTLPPDTGGQGGDLPPKRP
ncbi:hypothetical protein [Flavobacterium sp.]|uniref:hypothetical protein n=1 Tax=Flavobacterium sp. TaxID=239 RepID=UPI000EE04C06|nr:hypothetical protein [Flavobacterium sp.]HCQ12817.1 hypothetical protein [Flavobacterium sp.]